MVLKGDEGALEALRMVTTEAAARSNAYLLLEASVQLAAGEVLLGDPEDGLRVLAEARQGAGHEIAYFAAAMGRVAALAQVALGRLDDAGETLEAALGDARRQRLLYEEAQILLVQADLAERQGRKANDEVQEAHRLLHLLGVPVRV